MGEAFYYMKATFPKPLKRKEQKAIRKFFLEGQKAEDWWQDHRRDKKEVFWKAFEINFPTVSQYLKDAGLFGKDNNDLAGKLNFGSEDDIENSLSFSGSTVYYYAEVWHFATWEYIGEFLKSRFGAVRFNYLSDEYTDNFEVLDMQDDSGIVEDILKHKEILPTLIGINEKLDARIAEVLNK